MRNTKSRGILIGVGLLGVGAVVGLSQPVSAQSRRDVKDARQDVKEARKDVKAERKDVRQADTSREWREESRELAAAQQKLQKERQDLQREQQQRQQAQRQDYRSPYNQPRPYYQPGPYQTRPGYQPGRYNQPYYQPRPSYQTRDFRSVEGRIVDDLKGDSFVLRTDYGQQLRVHLDNEPSRLDPGDRVRVYGYQSNGVFYAQNFTILRNR